GKARAETVVTAIRWGMRAAVVVVVSLLAGCHPRGDGPPARARASNTWNGPAVLAQVPADSPYVVGLLEPPSEALRAKMVWSIDRRVVEALRATSDIPLDERLRLDPPARAVLAILDELRGDPTKWWDNLGFAHDGRWVVYGLSVWPVVRVEVADPAK